MSHAFFLQFDIMLLYYVFFEKKKEKSFLVIKMKKPLRRHFSFPSICWQPGRQKYIGSYTEPFLHIHVSLVAPWLHGVFNTLSVARGACSRADLATIQVASSINELDERQNK